MLYLNRRAGEAVIINNAIEVRVVEVRGRTVRLGFSFPAEVSVLREEVFLQIRDENEAAAHAAADAAGLGLRPERREPPPVALVMGSQSDWATMRHAADRARRAGRRLRRADRLGAPHARAPVRLRQGGRGQPASRSSSPAPAGRPTCPA